jgi:predicted DNA-binding transcriptional regulator YafY
MAPEAALALRVAQSDLFRLLPRPMLAQLDPYFEAATATLARLPGASFKRWRERVLVLPFALQLEPPDISEAVLEAVHDALLQRRQLDMVYSPRSDETPQTKRYRVNPLGLVIQDAAYYLVVTLFDYADIRHLALHRIREAHVLDEAAREPPGFSLARYAEETYAFDYPVGKPIRLQLEVTAWLAQHLAEQRLAKDQSLKQLKTIAWHRLTATVADTQKLRWWIRALGPNVRVIGPAKLRREIADDLREALAAYESDGASHRS